MMEEYIYWIIIAFMFMMQSALLYVVYIVMETIKPEEIDANKIKLKVQEELIKEYKLDVELRDNKIQRLKDEITKLQWK